MSFSIIIPSRNMTNLLACITAIRAAGETARIIIIDDGLFPNGESIHDIEASPLESLPGMAPAEMVPGVKPFVFSRNVNIGIDQAGTDDVFVMNDDALLETPHGLTAISDIAYANPQYGIIAASVDSCGTPNQNHCKVKTGLREERVMLAFICVFIPRKVLTELGRLDERFSVNAGGPGARGYGLEDDDYGWRARQAGYKLGVFNDTLVSHTKLPSTFREDKEHPADVKIHERLFEQKWGAHPRSVKASTWFGVK